MPKTNFYLAAIALGSVCLSCTFLKDRFVKDQNPLAAPAKVPEVQLFDRNAPPVSPGAVVVRRLAELDPSLSRFAPDFEAVERAVIGRAIAEAPGSSETRPKAEIEPLAHPPVSPDLDRLVPSGIYSPTKMMLAAGNVSSQVDRAQGIGSVGGLVAGMKETFTMGQTQASGGGPGKIAKSETKDGTTTTMGFELDFKPDGSSTFGIELGTEAEKDGKKVTAHLKGRIEGAECPDPDGNVRLKASFRLGGESGGTGYTQDVEVDIRATVGDDANIATRSFDIVQGAREVVGGNAAYVETGFTTGWDGDTAPSYTEYSNWRLIRQSQNAASDPPRAVEIAKGGQNAAIMLAQTILEMARYKWQGGGCVKIDAASPGKVDVGSTKQIPVKVVHKFDGADVPSKLIAELSGGTSIDPTMIPKTAGTLTYVAPGDSGKTATIKLKSTSRRGRAELDLTASTGGLYTVNSESNNVSFTGKICGSNKPFTLDATFPGGTSVMTFNPGGSMSSSGSGSGCTQTGSGTYKITENPDGSAALEWSSHDTVKCPMGFSNSRSNKFSVPLQPAPEVSCP